MRTSGRNASCICGSGQRYKHCCGSLERWEKIAEGARDAEQNEQLLQFQRRRQQGAGRPIVATRLGETRIVIVGRGLRRGRWQTFPDFLFDYIRDVVGRDWGQKEIDKPEEEKHPIIRWYQAVCLLQAKHIEVPGKMSSMPKYGVLSAYLGLAYDLYTLEHNEASTPGPEIFERLLHRLKHPDQFVGARYEIRIAAMFLRAGFQLTWEDETDGAVSHGEFTATFPETQQSFWVECKIRQRDSNASGLKLGKFVGLVSDALRKTTDQKRFVFVDLNTPAQSRHDKDQPDWRDWAVGRLRQFEASPAAQHLPAALVMVTNYPEHHHLDAIVPDAGGAIEGFKIADYRTGAMISLTEAIDRRERNPEVEALLHSMSEHRDIPNTFDGTIPGLDGAPDRLVIGRSYQIGDLAGILVEACVVEQEKIVAAVLQSGDGTQSIARIPLSELEVDAWHRFPETFFGVMREPQQRISSALDLYDFFFRNYAGLTKESLLKQLSERHDVSTLQERSQQEIARFVAERMTESALRRTEGFPVPTWAQRMRPPPARKED